MKKFKQGQTVYVLDRGYQYEPPRPSVVKIFLHSHKTPLPPEGCVIDKWPVDYFNEVINKWGSRCVFTSERKANSALKQITFK